MLYQLPLDIINSQLIEEDIIRRILKSIGRIAWKLLKILGVILYYAFKCTILLMFGWVVVFRRDILGIEDEHDYD